MEKLVSGLKFTIEAKYTEGYEIGLVKITTSSPHYCFVSLLPQQQMSKFHLLPNFSPTSINFHSSGNFHCLENCLITVTKGLHNC